MMRIPSIAATPANTRHIRLASLFSWHLRYAFVLFGFALMLAGCGGAYDSSRSQKSGAEAMYAPESAVASDMTGGESDLYQVLDNSASMVSVTVPDDVKIERKIIYNASITLYVEQFSDATTKIPELVKQYGGIISGSGQSLNPGSPRDGTWTIRVPVDHYRDFLAKLVDIGDIVSQHEDSQEVTAEFYDLEARLRSKVKEEERLLTHLDKDTAELKDILAVEAELTRVRTEIEQLEGRKRFLNDQTAMSTVTLTVNEVRDYVPEAAPGFGTQIGRSWTNSLDGLSGFFKGLVIFLVAAAPWLILLAIPGYFFFRWVRRTFRRIIGRPEAA